MKAKMFRKVFYNICFKMKTIIFFLQLEIIFKIILMISLNMKAVYKIVLQKKFIMNSELLLTKRLAIALQEYGYLKWQVKGIFKKCKIF